MGGTDTRAIAIRATTAEDLPAVDALLARSYPALLKRDYPPSLMVTAVPLLARARPELVSSGTYYIAEDAAGRALAVGGWTPGRRVAHRGEVRHVATDPGAVRRGVGGALLAHALAEAASAGIRQVDCLSTLGAVPFYRAAGFVETGARLVPLAPGIEFPVVAMVRRL
jgi:GNAT superfamily N-acetyltransferase